jgi:hypothetical protein
LRNALAIVCAFVLLLSSCAQSGTGERTFDLAGGRITVPGEAYMDGRRPTADEPYTYMEIGVVEDFSQTTAKCTIRHGTWVKVLDATRMAGGVTRHFLVSDGACTGWVTGAFLSDRYHEPVGKQY